MYNIIENFIKRMTKDDIKKFANKNNLIYTENEIDFLYSFIKSNYSYILKNPDSLDITLYKDKFSNNNYIFLSNLVNKYKRMIKI